MESKDQFHWSILLDSIEEGRVVPIIGPELLVFELDGRRVDLQRVLADRLAEALEIAPKELPPDFRLDDVALRFFENRGRRSVLYSTLHGLIQDPGLPVPEPLLRLAGINGLRLFVSTTFDGLMAKALDTCRFAGRPRTITRDFSLRKRVEDLPVAFEELEAPAVFRIFGASSTASDYVVTDEDLLEFVFALRSPDRRPKLLFDALRECNLLVLGCSFPNWLSRFFVRVISDMRLVDRRYTLETIADDRTAQDRNLVLFMRHCDVSVFEGGGTLDFLDELCRRWQALHPEPTRADPLGLQPEIVQGLPRGPGGAIFLSYASEDRDMVLVFKEHLEAAGIEVWFDQRRLEAGDVYEHKIRRNIASCSFFFPCISRASAGRIEGYYRKEWHWAIERSRRFEAGFPFIQPIVLDDTPYAAEGIPEEFSSRHWQVFPGGVPTEEFLELTRKRVRDVRKALAGRS